MTDHNWRIDTDATGYFSHQKRRLDIADRRPVIRRASDLVGPGIGKDAVRLGDMDEPMARFNGYYSIDSTGGSLPAPGQAYVGWVVSDPDLGGAQTLVGLSDNTMWRRTFTRGLVDRESIGWSPWEQV